MNEALKKQKSEAVKRSVVENIAPAKQGGQQDAPGAEALAYWKDEVDALRGETFETLDQAVDVIIGRILVRMQAPSELNGELKLFLREILETDPEIVEGLRQLLTIKQP